MRALTVLMTLIVLALPCQAARAADEFFSPASDRTIRADAYVAAPIAEVWRTLTTGEGWKAFNDTPATIDLRPGGTFEVRFAPDAPEGQRGSEGCTVLSYLPERMLSFTWNAPPKFPDVRAGTHKTIVVIELLPAGAKRTRVVLRHHGWPVPSASTEQWDGAYTYFEKAWPSVLSGLVSYFEPKPGAQPDKLPAAADPAPDPKAGWLYTFVALKRPDLIDTLTDEEKRQFGEHASYIQKLAREGTVIFAGPCTDMKGPAVVILDVRTEAEGRTLMENDPAVKNGLMKADLHPVRLSFVRWRD